MSDKEKEEIREALVKIRDSLAQDVKDLEEASR